MCRRAANGQWNCHSKPLVSVSRLDLFLLRHKQAAKNATARRDKEYYVKWRGRAHIHCYWVPGARMEVAAARSKTRGVQPKLQAFERAQIHGEVHPAAWLPACMLAGLRRMSYLRCRVA